MTARARAQALVDEWRTTNGVGIDARQLLQALIEVIEAESFHDLGGGADTEIARLASFLLETFPDEPGRVGTSESAVDVAIRLLAGNTRT